MSVENTQEKLAAVSVGSTAWFGALDVADHALQAAKRSLLDVDLPPYPAGGVCGINNMGRAMESIKTAQDAVHELHYQLNHWTAMNEAYGPLPNHRGETRGGHG